MTDNIRRNLCLLILPWLIACGSGGGESGSDEDIEPDPGVSALGNRLNLRFNFSVQSAQDIVCVTLPCPSTTTFNFPDEYEVPLYLKATGQLTLRAQDFPRMVLRLCDVETARDDCDYRMDDNRLTLGADLVMDLCGADRDNAACGNEGNDPTLFEGSINAEGRMVITGISVRLRIFLLGTSGPDGFTASDIATGILPLPHLTVVTQTDPEINTGRLSGMGQRIDENGGVTLVAGGIIPTAMPELGGSHYLSTMTGTFDIDPLPLLD